MTITGNVRLRRFVAAGHLWFNEPGRKTKV